MTVIGELALGHSIYAALRDINGGVRAFFRNDALGRLFVLLHADFGDRTELSRDVFYSWRGHGELRTFLEATIAGQRLLDDAEDLSRLVVPRLVRTPEAERGPLAREIAEAAFAAAPYVAEGGSQAIALLLNRLEPGQQKILAAVRGQQPDRESAVNLAAALVVGPLRHLGAEDDVREAEQAVEAGDRTGGAETLLGVADRLETAGLSFAADTLRERAANYFAAGNAVDRAIPLMQMVIENRISQGSSLYRFTLEAFAQLLSSEDTWTADALEALANWPENPEGAGEALHIAVERSAGGPDHLRWLARYVELLGMMGELATVLTVTAKARRTPIASGPRVAIELEALEAAEGNREEADRGWRELLRWADEQAEPFDRALIWQRRGVLLARREQVPDAHDAYRRAMSSWAEIPGFEEQAGDAFFSMQAVSTVNARPPPDPALRPLAFSLRGSGDTPAGRIQRDQHQGMASRLEGRLPDALRAFWRAFACSRQIGSLQGILELTARLAELYEHAGEIVAGLQFSIAAGKGDSAQRLAVQLRGPELRAVLPRVGGSRWERAATYQTLAAVGRLTPNDVVALYAELLLSEAAGEVDAILAPQPVLAAKRALAAVAFGFPKEHQPKVWRQLLLDLWHPLFDVVGEAAKVLVPATNLGLVEAESELVERFLRDPFNTRISSLWVAERASANAVLADRLREAGQEGNLGALEALAAADLIGDDEVLQHRCSEEARRAALTATIEESSEQRSVTMGVRFEGSATIASAAEPVARHILLARLIAIATDEREPEANRASATGGIHNLVTALSEEQAQEAFVALEAVALGQYTPSEWDENIENPLSRFRLHFHTEHVLRIAAIHALAHIAARADTPRNDNLQRVIDAAFRDGPEPVVAAALDATAALPNLQVPIPLETLMRAEAPEIRRATLPAWAARHDELPDPATLAALRVDPDFRVRQNLLSVASDAGNQGREVIATMAESDPDAYLRLRAASDPAP